MKAAVYRTFGPPDVVRSRRHPNLKCWSKSTRARSAPPTTARTRNVPQGLGMLAALGLGFFRPRNPVVGMDVAGVVGAGVTRFTPGDEVIAMLGFTYCGQAEYVCVPQGGAITAKPRNMKFEEAVTLVFGGITALAKHKYLTAAEEASYGRFEAQTTTTV